MKYKHIIKLRLPEIQLLTSSMQTTVFNSPINGTFYFAIHTALLNNIRKVGRLVLSRTSCLFWDYAHCKISYDGYETRLIVFTVCLIVVITIIIKGAAVAQAV
jgi:hypothetical protein